MLPRFNERNDSIIGAKPNNGSKKKGEKATYAISLDDSVAALKDIKADDLTKSPSPSSSAAHFAVDTAPPNMKPSSSGTMMGGKRSAPGNYSHGKK